MCCFLEEIFNGFSFFRNLFSNEFLLCPGAAVQVGSRSIHSKQKVPKGLHVSLHSSCFLWFIHTRLKTSCSGCHICLRLNKLRRVCVV